MSNLEFEDNYNYIFKVLSNQSTYAPLFRDPILPSMTYGKSNFLFQEMGIFQPERTLKQSFLEYKAYEGYEFAIKYGLGLYPGPIINERSK